MNINRICILGGTGFVGTQLAARLANHGYQLKILTRHRERHKKLLVVPWAQLIQADVRDADALSRHFRGCDAVVNLIGILNGTEQEFHAVHAALPKQIASACVEAGVPRLLHMSAINADADKGPSLYLRSKGQGEAAVFSAAEQGLQVSCFRPSVIFGPDDSFFNRFATLLKISPLMPLACPNSRFAPVYIGDVVDAFRGALTAEECFGKSLQLCGPRVYTLRELVELTGQMIGDRPWIWDLPDNLAQLQAKIFERIPGKPFTMDNYRSLQVDSVCSQDGFAGLGITPRSVESIMPNYFAGKMSRTSRYNSFRKVGRR